MKKSEFKNARRGSVIESSQYRCQLSLRVDATKLRRLPMASLPPLRRRDFGTSRFPERLCQSYIGAYREETPPGPAAAFHRDLHVANGFDVLRKTQELSPETSVMSRRKLNGSGCSETLMVCVEAVNSSV